MAKGGGGGDGVTGAASVGGASGSGVGDTKFSGGAGGSQSTGGGGGGGGAGDNGNGGAVTADSATGGSSGPGIGRNGGAGSSGVTGAGSSGAGKIPGGASGGGGGLPGAATGNAGGGIIVLTYTTTAIPTTNTDLANRMTSKNYADVAVDDGGYFIQTGSENVIAQFQKTWTNTSDNITITWNGRTTVSPAKSPVLLQIYNVNSATWETIATNTLSPVDTDFTLQATVSNTPSNYYDTNKMITARVYQLVY